MGNPKFVIQRSGDQFYIGTSQMYASREARDGGIHAIHAVMASAPVAALEM